MIFASSSTTSIRTNRNADSPHSTAPSHDRFAEPDPEPDRLADAVLTRFQVARFDAEAAVNFAPEVEENVPAAGHNARGVFVAHNGRGGLAENRLQEFFRVLNAFFRDGDNPLGVQILTDALVLNGVRREIVGESFRQRDRFFRFDRLGVCVRRG